MILLRWLEGDMARHMLLEFPLLMAAGAALAHVATPRVTAAIERIDRLGLTGWTFTSLVLAFWMIPAALDAAIASALVNAAKYATLFAAGFAARGAIARSPRVLQAFFIGNLVWMAATVGIVYQEAPRQLCLYYRVDAQVWAGRGLIVASVAVAAAWLYAVLRTEVLQGSRDTRLATQRSGRPP